MRRLNRGLFQLALENEEVRTQETPAEDVPSEAAADAPRAEVPAVEVTVQVEVPGEAEVVKTETGEAAARETARAETAVATEDEEARARAEAETREAARAETPAETPSSEVPAEAPVEDARPVEEPSEAAPEVPAEVPAEEPAVPAETREAARAEAPVAEEPSRAEVSAEPAREASTTVAEGETAEVKNAEGETVATVETSGETTTIETAGTEVVVSQTEDGRVSVDVTVAADEAPAVATEDMVVIETDGERAEVEISEAVDVAEDTSELDAEIDGAQDAAVALEALAEVVQAAAGNGGLDVHGARLVKIATEHIYDHMGLPSGRTSSIVAMESFEVPGLRASATSVALEDIKENAKKIWAAIVEGIKKAAAWVMEFIQKIMTANGRIKARAEKLLQATEGMSGSPKEKQVGDAKLVRSVAVNGKVPANLAAELKKVVDFFAGTVSDKTVMSLRSVERAMSSAKTEQDAEKLQDEIRTAITAIAGKGLAHKVSNGLGEKAGVAAAPQGTSISMSPTFLGEQVVWAYMPESIEAITNFRSGIGVGQSRIGDDAKATVLSANQIADIAKVALQYVDASEKYKEVQAQVEKLSAVFAGQMAGYSAATQDNGHFKNMMNAMKAVRQLIKGIHQPAGVVAARAVNASLDLATASAKQYGAKVAEPAAAAA